MTDRRTVETFQDILGAGTLHRRPGRGVRKPSFVWYCGHRVQLRAVLEYLTPYLVTKAAPAALALEFLNATDESERHRIRAEMRGYTHRRGRSVNPARAGKR